MKHVTTITGPALAYKTAMLILVANEEARKGHYVRYLTRDESERSLRDRGLDARVLVLFAANDKDSLGKVVSAVAAASQDVHIWRIRQCKKVASTPSPRPSKTDTQEKLRRAYELACARLVELGVHPPTVD